MEEEEEEDLEEEDVDNDVERVGSGMAGRIGRVARPCRRIVG